ncbi:MAG: glycine dehydrogenase (aminomethyl-transferring) [Calditrichaeota bacterium]|nr:MAG: glycine dehydrogenase (aminomethyl-transferring) [Calditrichota bacterium]
MKINEAVLQSHNTFLPRHIGINETERDEMLKTMGCDSLEQLLDETIPENIRLSKPLNLPDGMDEFHYLEELRNIAKKNKVYRSYIGLGYYDCVTPPVLLRNIFENPGWYTSYTPYQAEISQGRQEALLIYQTMVSDLTGLEIANASLLDEATAAAEAMSMCYRLRSKELVKRDARVFFVSDKCFPQTIDVVLSRAESWEIEVKVGDVHTLSPDDELFGVLLQYPDVNGNVEDYSELIARIQQTGAKVVVAADLLSLTLLKSPGEMGADVAVGSTQRFGVPMGYGGPHAAYYATREENKRQVPGRLIGISIDRLGNPGYRMSLQTREQHIRREKATSNICTAQSLLAIMAAMYAVYHGPDGLKRIAERIHALAYILSDKLTELGCQQLNPTFFDTIHIRLPETTATGNIRQQAEAAGMNFRYINERELSISLDETTTLEDLQDILGVFAATLNVEAPGLSVKSVTGMEIPEYPKELKRTTDFLTHPVFHEYRTETKMMRYLKYLENKDLSLTHSMIPLGSCTMKLNSATEMLPVTWPEFSRLHPFVPLEQAEGYQQLIRELEDMLCEITGFAAVSFQPNSGAQGEYTGMRVIRAYHLDRGEPHRNVVLIPSSAHGTNPASGVMAGMKVIIVKCDAEGNIDVEDLKAKAEQYRDSLAALMVTYPSTHGVFEEAIQEICQIVHECGGQVYMDGANMNAQVGLTNPAIIGADVCHLNLHKTFSIPHGGGGPGMGPIAVAEHLKPYLPRHPLVEVGGEKGIHAVSATPWGSASILPISHAYIKLLGKRGVTEATEYAILNANYIKARLEKYYPVLYTGKHGRNAHELIFDCRPFKQSAGVEVEDIAKRLMDYGFHAPTISFPVAGTMMVEPTESESKDELDRFCDALISIYHEIEEIAEGKADPQDNVLKNAPHTIQEVLSDEWPHSYSREKAAYPLPYLRKNKFWPSVARIDNVYGDRNLVCTLTAQKNMVSTK